MVAPHEKLAESLEALKKLQERGNIAIRSNELTRSHRELLLKNGFLGKVMKGWYIPVKPEESKGDSTLWYASFWHFCASYLKMRFGQNWCLSPEQSLLLHVGNMTVPKQLLVRSPKARNKITTLPHGTSLFDIRGTLPRAENVSQKEGMRLFSVPEGLVNCGAEFFSRNSTDARIALAMINDASDILIYLLEGGRSTVAGRIAGAFRNIERDRIADNIIKTMQSAGFDVREKDPFKNTSSSILSIRGQSPYVNRLYLLWEKMREAILETFPPAPGPPKDIHAYLKAMDDIYVSDAYHSLSIEGYRVTPELIERVRKGDWRPKEGNEDLEQYNALTARGYWQAYQLVRKSIQKVLEGENPGQVCEVDHSDWFREMFSPLVFAGLLKPTELAGYRNHQVYIRQSMHVPPRFEAVRECMPAFFDLLENESEPSVRVVLGHFVFVYIHPYLDGNGRIGRFLMNVMLSAAGYPWTVIPIEKRDDYMAALEIASVEQNIKPFSHFIGHLVSEGLEMNTK